jgi:hypothetical protein
MTPSKSNIQVKPIKLKADETPAAPGSPTPTVSADASQPRLVKTMNQVSSKKVLVTILGAIIIVAAGIGSGYGLSRVTAKTTSGLKSAAEVTETGVQVGDVIGSQDEKTFRDKAEGVLVRGGIDGEGSHHLLREGGPSQNVYLTSSVVDLDQFVDHKIKVWGETFAAQHAGWLMDVGRVEVRELNAEKPFEEE